MKSNLLQYFAALVLSILIATSCNTTEPCDDVTCINDGVCVEGICDCPTGFSGAECENEDLCITQNVICNNGGICVDGLCECPTGFTGDNCELINTDDLQYILDEGILSPLDLVEEGVSQEMIWSELRSWHYLLFGY